MDAVVQFLRNVLCCCKDLSVFDGTFLHDAAVTRGILGEFLPDPMDRTTPLEAIISLTQLYACISSTQSGYTLLTTSLGKLRRISRIVNMRLRTPTNDWSQADLIVNESLIKEAKFALRSAFIGFLVLPIGISFFWLTCNSWHITETDWIGGVQALIYALIVMEIALVPLLVYMIMDGFEMLAKSKRCRDLLSLVDEGKLKASEIGVQRYETMTGWLPFWDSGVPLLQSPNPKEEKLLQAEIEQIKDTLTTWFPKNNAKKEKEDKLSKEALTDAIEKLETAATTQKIEGYREFLYFVFNFVAFYGYLMAPLVFYYNNEESQPYHIQSMKLFYDNDYADWLGNFAGDLMWSIEPIVILGSPLLIQIAKPPSIGKVKSD